MFSLKKKKKRKESAFARTIVFEKTVQKNKSTFFFLNKERRKQSVAVVNKLQSCTHANVTYTYNTYTNAWEKKKIRAQVHVYTHIHRLNKSLIVHVTKRKKDRVKTCTGSHMDTRVCGKGPFTQLCNTYACMHKHRNLGPTSKYTYIYEVLQAKRLVSCGPKARQ